MASNGGRTGPQWAAAERHVAATYTHCLLCGHPVNFRLNRKTNPLGWTVEHPTPISRGGHPYASHNTNLAHRRCNIEKGDKTLPEYRAWQRAQGRTPSDLPPGTNGPSRQWLTT